MYEILLAIFIVLEINFKLKCLFEFQIRPIILKELLKD